MRHLHPWWSVIALSAALATPCLAGPPAARAPESRAERDRFGFVFETDDGARVDTFRGLVTKDLVWDPDTTIALVLTPAELDSIYRQVLAVRLFTLPDLRAPLNCSESPHTGLRLRVQAGGKERLIQWDSGWDCSAAVRASESWKGLHAVVGLIRQIVEARPEYKALPSARGFYL